MLLARYESDERTQQNVTASPADRVFVPLAILSLKADQNIHCCARRIRLLGSITDVL